ncbi:hypothetical protein K431DRAFT_328693, partial [Polychaeton citri CBS 116435]
VDFFSLPCKIRDDIYNRVLVIPYQLHLFQDTTSRVETFAPERPREWLALLYTNRQMRREASAILYKVNIFDLMDTTQQPFDLLKDFLNQVGPVNAGSLSHVCISLPVIEGQPGNFQLREDGSQNLKLLQKQCTGLATLEFHIYSSRSSTFPKADQGDFKFVQKMLKYLELQLKVIPSLEKVIIRIYDRTLPSPVIDIMKGFGWIVLR